MSAGARTVWWVCATVVCSGCAPEFVDEPWRVSEARVLAISADPPEARPNTSVTLSALVVDLDGEVSEAPQWSFCTRPRTSEERTAVTQACLEGAHLQPTSSVAQVLPDACARFGPNPPPAEAGAPAQRPADPDRSGGYFLPVRAETQDALAFGAVRVRCDLPGVTRAIFDAYQERYVENVAPTIAVIAVQGRTVEVVEGRASLEVPADAEVDFEVELAATASERFVVYDPARGVLNERSEAIEVRWFVTDGDLAQGLQRIEGAEVGETPVQTRWRTPSTVGVTPAWVVVTDERGATAWVSLSVAVGP